MKQMDLVRKIDRSSLNSGTKKILSKYKKKLIVKYFFKCTQTSGKLIVIGCLHMYRYKTISQKTIHFYISLY